MTIEAQHDSKRYGGRDHWLLGVARHPPFIHKMRSMLTEQGAKPVVRPWLTLTLGSGCTTSDSQVNHLRAVGKEVCNRIDGDDFKAEVKLVVEHLISDRLGEARSGTPKLEGSVDTVAFELVAPVFNALACLIVIFHRAKAATLDPPRRLGHDNEAVFDFGTVVFKETASKATRALDQMGLVRSGLEHLIGLLVPDSFSGVEDGRHGTGPDPKSLVQGSIEALLNRLCDGLRGAGVPNGEGNGTLQRRLSFSDLMAWNELAWLCLTSRKLAGDLPPAYPGWGDLLGDLSYYDTLDPVGIAGFNDINGAHRFVYARYADVTKASYERKEGSSSLYDAAARALLVQADKLASTGGIAAPPSACAFVTSFDLELELALLRQFKLGSSCQRFTMAFPVHLIHDLSGRAMSFWLAVSVGNGSAEPLGELLAPEAGKLKPFELEDQPSAGGPLIVHLCGCPLIRFPLDGRLARPRDPAVDDFAGLRRKLEKLFGSQLAEIAKAIQSENQTLAQAMEEAWEGSRLHHALIINEHDAMVQNLSDMSGRNPGSTHTGPGLDPALVANTDKWKRFWMLLGVQVRDHAVRQRVSNLMSGLRIFSSERNAVGVRRHVGIAVNKRIGELEQELLFWQGLHVVTDEAEAFVKDLDAYTMYVQGEQA